MNAQSKENAKEKLLVAATNAFRRQGYTATTADQICSDAGVTKGAFFHHFKSKEDIGAACLESWGEMAAAMDASACARCLELLGEDAEPLEKAVCFMNSVIEFFSNPKLLKSCAAGTLIHEIHEASDTMRKAARCCFDDAELRLKTLLDDASARTNTKVDTASLASLWIATMQGSMTLSKASGDESLIARNLEHVRQYIVTLLAVAPSRKRTQKKSRGRK